MLNIFPEILVRIFCIMIIYYDKILNYKNFNCKFHDSAITSITSELFLPHSFPDRRVLVPSAKQEAPHLPTFFLLLTIFVLFISF